MPDLKLPLVFRYFLLIILIFSFNNSIFALQFFDGQTVIKKNRYSFERGLMGSPFKLVIYASNDSIAQIVANKAFQRVEQLNEMISDYRDGSEINRLSAQSGSGKWIPVSKDLFEILEISLDIAKKTNGDYDITVGPLVQMWRHATRKSIFPSQQEIDSAKAKTGYSKMKLDRASQSVMLTQKGMRLDIGGLGKGFAAEKAIEVVKEFGIESAMMDAGGKIVLTNPPPGEEGWNITISNGSDSLKTLKLSNIALATSGPTYRYFEYNGIRYSHILNPRTGTGLLFHVRTTAICKDGTVADALATAFSVSGVKAGKKYLKKFPGTKVWMVEQKNGRIISWNTIN